MQTLVQIVFGVISNSDGKADLSLFKNNEVIVISHVSYKRKNIIKEALRDSIIYLKQMTNILPDIVLTEKQQNSSFKKTSCFYN